jgi:hypothetical protein
MFILDAFLEIEEIRCFEINHDASGPPLQEMVRHYRKVQETQRPLVVRGSFTPDELRLLLDSLDPRGLLLLIMVENLDEVDAAGSILGL